MKPESADDTNHEREPDTNHERETENSTVNRWRQRT